MSFASSRRWAVAYRRIRPKALHRTSATPVPLQELWRTREAAARPVETVVVHGLDDAVPDHAVAVTGRQLWNATRLVREVPHVRRAQDVVVVGGAASIRRIWREYRIRPRVVYVPDTTPTVPAWCLGPELPTVVVRCSPVEVNRTLLSAAYNDGFAAEFPLPVQPPLSVVAAEGGEGGDDDAAVAAVAAGPQPPQRLGSMLVLSGLRIPSNVGLLLRAAVDLGYDSALLHDCVDVFHEKVLRASEGTVLSPRLKVFECGGEAAVGGLLRAIARRHRLLPLFAVPSPAAEPAFAAAKRFHDTNRRGGGAGRLGPMLLLGSEARGLGGLLAEGPEAWDMPTHTISIPLPNASIDSVNVSVAGSILLHLFRPAAAAHFRKIAQAHGDDEGDVGRLDAAPPPLLLHPTPPPS